MLEAEPGPDGVFRVTPASLAKVTTARGWRDRDGDAAFWSAWIKAGPPPVTIGLDLSTRPDLTAFTIRRT